MEFNSIQIFILFLLSSLVLVSCLAFKYWCQASSLQKEVDYLRLREEGTGNAKFSELGLMSAGIAHEINNPLSIIQARTSQLLRQIREPDHEGKVIEGLNLILYTSGRISRTIQGIREFIYQQDQASEDNIPLKDLLDNVLIFCGQRLKNHGVEIRFSNIDGACLKGHRVQLEQAFLNLINNSFDAIDELPDKWIEISAIEEDNTVNVFFKDSGKGIPFDVNQKMMEPFFTTKKERGTGLGLPLVKGIAEKHGGDLMYVERASNTTFLLELPKSPAVAAHQ